MEIFFIVTNYIHESGHIIFGFMDGLIRSNITRFDIGNWVKDPFFKVIYLPQQTKIIQGQGSLNFALGGPLFSIMIFLGLSFIGYSISKEKKWFLLFLSILIFEISGNIICGTDNFYGNPLSLCNKNIDLYIQYLCVFLFSGLWSYFTVRKINEKMLKRLKFKL